MDVIVNKVAESGIITLDLSEFLPKDESLVIFDLKPFLFREMILKEKDYRAALLTTDWEQYREKEIAITCTTDAIIPVWAYMLAASYLEPVASSVYYGSIEELRKHLIVSRISVIDPYEYEGKRVVLKGCGDVPVPEIAYVKATALLRPVVKSIMYGEPCSTVPIYKSK